MTTIGVGDEEIESRIEADEVCQLAQALSYPLRRTNMVWSQHDFERELKRQLIEIESIRKRVPQLDEIMERLDRLEASHLCLIRKLSEYFQRANDRADSGSSTSGPLTDFETDEEEIARELDLQPASDDEGPLAEFHVLADQQSRLARRCVLDGPPSPAEGGTAQRQEPSRQVVLLAEAVFNVPDLNERCASCGKVLISSLLAGEGITQQGPDWHHQACIDDNQDGRNSSILN